MESQVVWKVVILACFKYIIEEAVSEYRLCTLRCYSVIVDFVW